MEANKNDTKSRVSITNTEVINNVATKKVVQIITEYFSITLNNKEDRIKSITTPKVNNTNVRKTALTIPSAPFFFLYFAGFQPYPKRLKKK